MKRTYWVTVLVILLFCLRIIAIKAIIDADLNTKTTIVMTNNIASVTGLLTIIIVFVALLNFNFEGLRNVLHSIRNAINDDAGHTRLSYDILTDCTKLD